MIARTKSQLLLLFWIALLMCVGFFSGFIIGVSFLESESNSNRASIQSSAYFDGKLYDEVRSLLYSSYVDRSKLDDKKLFFGSLKGMVQSIGDPYTVFLDPQTHQEFNEELEGSFDGIGAELGIKNDRLTVIAPLPDSPAQKAGLRAADLIVSINGEDTGSLTLDEAVARIRGKAGTTVELSIYRPVSESLKTITIKRSRIVVPSVSFEMRDSIAVVSLFNFNVESERQFVKIVQELRTAPVQGIILDLRNNPGGFLDKAVNIASAWLSSGTVVVRELYQNERSSTEYSAIRQVSVPAVPTVVLVNEGTASAAEILAGALQDYDRATIVGTMTYGKGSVQELKTLSDGSALKITISQWVTPKGRFINDVGVEPDILVPVTADDITSGRDPQLDKAIELIIHPENGQKTES